MDYGCVVSPFHNDKEKRMDKERERKEGGGGGGEVKRERDGGAGIERNVKKNYEKGESGEEVQTDRQTDWLTDRKRDVIQRDWRGANKKLVRWDQLFWRQVRIGKNIFSIVVTTSMPS